MIYSFGVISAQDLIEIIFCQAAIPFQILEQEVDFFFCGFYLFRCSA